MNTGALANVLRHLLYLLVVLKMINGIILIYSTKTCFGTVHQLDLLPLNMAAPRHSVFIALREAEVTVLATSFAIIIVSVMGIIGTTYLHTYPSINFAVGLNSIFVMTGEFGCALFLRQLSLNFKLIVVNPIEYAFTECNSVVDNDKKDRMTVLRDQLDTWRGTLEADGWIGNISGTDSMHRVVDFIHTSMECCGLHGRDFWQVRIPASCCDRTKYPLESCMVGNAYTSSCLYNYYYFESCMGEMVVQCICFGLLSLAAGVCSLYLTKLHVLYPTEDYGSETSSDSDEALEYY